MLGRALELASVGWGANVDKAGGRIRHRQLDLVIVDSDGPGEEAETTFATFIHKPLVGLVALNPAPIRRCLPESENHRCG
jgi:hypothetical protein